MKQSIIFTVAHDRVMQLAKEPISLIFIWITLCAIEVLQPLSTSVSSLCRQLKCYFVRALRLAWSPSTRAKGYGFIVIALSDCQRPQKAERSDRRRAIVREDQTFYPPAESSHSETGAIVGEEVSLGYG